MIKLFQTKKTGFFPNLLRILRNLMLLFFIISISWVILARFIPIYITPLMVIRTVESIAESKTPKNSKKWVSIEGISPNMIQAVVASEDNLFLQHHGFSINDISKAFEHNQKGKRIRGGSTISQQTAKNVFLWPNRSYLRKGLEAYFTVLIEIFWSKERIMEAYLNVIEMGDGIYGIEAASLEFYGKNATKLTKGQAALIAACLPNPRKYDVSNPSGFIVRRKSKIMRLMGKIDQVNFNTNRKSNDNLPKKKHRK